MLTLMQTSAQLAKDAVAPLKSGKKSNKHTIDLRRYDVHELKRFRVLMTSSVSSLKNMPQDSAIAGNDPSKMLKNAPGGVKKVPSICGILAF